MSTPDDASIRDLAAAYALGALSPEETRAFEAYLAGSPEARQDVAELRETAALLAVAGLKGSRVRSCASECWIGFGRASSRPCRRPRHDHLVPGFPSWCGRGSLPFS